MYTVCSSYSDHLLPLMQERLCFVEILLVLDKKGKLIAIIIIAHGCMVIVNALSSPHVSLPNTNAEMIQVSMHGKWLSIVLLTLQMI